MAQRYATTSSNFLKCPISNAYNLDKIKQIKQYRRLGASELRDIVSIDTETYNGNIIVLADSEDNYIDYPHITMENVISFLFKHIGKWIFCYNLSFDGDIISKLLGDLLNQYIKTGRLVFDCRFKR